MKTLAYAVKSSSRTELFNCIMYASVHMKNERPSFMRSVTSLLEGPQCTQIIGEVIDIKLNYFIKFHYYSHKFYTRKLKVITFMKCKLLL